MIAPKTISEKMASEGINKFITFDLILGTRTLGMALNVQKVKEVVEFSSLSELPSQTGYIIGVYNLRGCPVPVLDIQAMISKTPATIEDRAQYLRLVICELQGIWVGIPVGKTGRIMTCRGSDFLPPPQGSKIESTKLISGLIRKDGVYIPVLDIDSIMNAAGFDEEHSEASSKANLFAGKRILLVDDSKIMLKRLDRLFQHLGCVTVTATHGREAIEKLVETGFQFDLIFTDIEMPILNGILMAREIRSTLPQAERIPIVFNSSLSNPLLIQDIQNEKLGDYLVKFDESLIVDKLTNMFS